MAGICGASKEEWEGWAGPEEEDQMVVDCLMLMWRPGKSSGWWVGALTSSPDRASNLPSDLIEQLTLFCGP